MTVDARELAETAQRLVRSSGAPGNEPMPTVLSGLSGEEEPLLGWDEDWVLSERER
ncbi:hypothetical protein [Streptomyces sp. NPDC008122]|uniref:hypothetical protein n=1 Tax=Streptomyces sp. NPDC008122 TaxID=3364810 RepID=UPI0036E116E9